MRKTAALLLLGLIMATSAGAQCTFTNPLMQGADPHASFHGGKYYLLVTRGDRVTIKSSARLQDIGPLTEILAWHFKGSPAGGHIWAPELHQIDGDWYIYTCGQNTGLDYNEESVPYVQERQEMFVLKSVSGDPLGPYEFVDWLMPGVGAIDATVFTHSDGKRYIIWSQFNIPDQPQNQHIYIGELTSPTTIGVQRVLLSTPDQEWELHGWPVNEGAAVLQKNGLTYIVYSGSGFTTPEYALGYLVNSDGDLLKADSWTKVGPVFQQNAAGGVYSTGHNSFTTSPNGTEDWMVYHARLSPDGHTRYTFMQKFTWDGDVPDFGVPIPLDQDITCPSDTGQILGLQPEALHGLDIHPNPASCYLNISLPKEVREGYMQVHNTLGQLCWESSIREDIVNVSHLPVGLYFLQICSGQKIYRGSFIKGS